MTTSSIVVCFHGVTKIIFRRSKDNFTSHLHIDQSFAENRRQHSSEILFFALRIWTLTEHSENNNMQKTMMLKNFWYYNVKFWPIICLEQETVQLSISVLYCRWIHWQNIPKTKFCNRHWCFKRILFLMFSLFTKCVICFY